MPDRTRGLAALATNEMPQSRNATIERPRTTHLLWAATTHDSVARHHDRFSDGVFLHLNAVNGLIGAPIAIWFLLRQKSLRTMES
jgi:hypothetical protein